MSTPPKAVMVLTMKPVKSSLLMQLLPKSLKPVKISLLKQLLPKSLPLKPLWSSLLTQLLLRLRSDTERSISTLTKARVRRKEKNDL